MAVPVKYREIGDFHHYYSGKRVAPYLTIFVGGNHEASNHNFELFYGGWVAPKIYFMGAANVVRLGGLRIAGLSGIWKGYDYRKPHLERLPYNEDDLKSIYHVREIDSRRLLQLRSQVDIGVSHDWPQGVEMCGDFEDLFKRKAYFRRDAENGQLGSVAARDVLKWLRPFHWFSAHLHCRYAAIVKHGVAPDGLPGPSAPAGEAPPDASAGTSKNDDEIDLDLDDEGLDDESVAAVAAGRAAAQPVSAAVSAAVAAAQNGRAGEKESAELARVSENLRAQLPASFARPAAAAAVPEPNTSIHNDVTKFLALSKCLPNQHFLHLMEMDAPDEIDLPEATGSLRLEYDAEWLAITRVFADHIKVGDASAHVAPDAGRGAYAAKIDVERVWVEEHVVKAGKLVIPENFSITAPVYKGIANPAPLREYRNPQTEAFCKMLEIPNPLAATEEELEARMERGPRPSNHHARGASQNGSRGGGSRGRGGRRGGVRGRGRGRGR